MGRLIGMPPKPADKPKEAAPAAEKPAEPADSAAEKPAAKKTQRKRTAAK